MTGLDRLEQIANNLLWRSQYEEENRLELLFVHAFIGIGAGVLMIIDGVPSRVVEIVGAQEAVVYPLAVLPCVGGLTLLFGLLYKRRLLVEWSGMAMIMLWDTLMGSSLFLVNWLAAMDSSPETVSTMYPVAVYMGLAALMRVHLKTLRKFRKLAMKTGAL